MLSKDIIKILFRIKKRIQDYFDNSDSYQGIYVNRIDDKFIELKNTIDKVCVKIPFSELFKIAYVENKKDIDKYRKILNDMSERKISNTFWSISANRYYYDKDKKLETWESDLISYKERLIIGFYNKRGRKAEFLMEENRHISFDEYVDIENINLLLKFNIGKVKIKISKPTPMFKLIYRDWINIDYDEFWSYYETIQIEGVSRSKLNKYLQQAIFWCNIYNNINNQSVLIFGAERILKHTSNYCNYNYSGNVVQFLESKSEYDEKPFAFFNQAFANSDETAFLYYYKVLEFFFFICKNNESEYEKEEICLKRLLLELNYDNEVRETIDMYFGEHLLEIEDNNNIDIDNISIEKFAEKLYKYRNSIVHGKYNETNLLIHVPMNLINNYEAVKVKGWNDICSYLALLSIKYFCFDKKINNFTQSIYRKDL